MPPNRPGRRVAATTAVAALAGVLIAVPGAGAAAPTVTGSVTGKLPPASRALTAVRAIELGAAQVAATAHVGAKGAFRLALAPGAYVLDVSVTPRRGRAAHRAVPVSIAPGQRRRGMRIAKPGARAAAVGARAAVTQESGAIDPGRIAFVVEEFAGATGVFSGMDRGLDRDARRRPLEQPSMSHGPGRGSARPCARPAGAQAPEVQVLRSIDPRQAQLHPAGHPDPGRLRSHGATLAYTVTLVDARTRVALETLSGTMPSATFFEAEQRLAAQLAKRICAYGEVFELTYTGTGTGNFPTHSAAGTLSAQAITAKPTAHDAQGATRWEGTSPMSWTGVTATSKIDCSFRDFLSGGTWTAKLDRVGETLRVLWIADPASNGTATVACPDGSRHRVDDRGPADDLAGRRRTRSVHPAVHRSAGDQRRARRPGLRLGRRARAEGAHDDGPATRLSDPVHRARARCRCMPTRAARGSGRAAARVPSAPAR